MNENVIYINRDSRRVALFIRTSSSDSKALHFTDKYEVLVAHDTYTRLWFTILVANISFSEFVINYH